MQILINQTQIEKAIIDLMHKRINLQPGTQLVVEMKATRGAEGFSAVVDIVDSEDAFQEEKAQETARVKAAKEEKLVSAGPAFKAAVKAPVEAAPEVPVEGTEVLEEEPVKEEAPEAVEEEVPTTKPKSIFNSKVKA